MDTRDAEFEALRAENVSLRRSGAEAVHAYQRKKERCDELMESLIDLHARYDALAASTVPSTTTTSTNTDPTPSASAFLEAHISELELALAAKDDLLQGLQVACAQKDAEITRKDQEESERAAAKMEKEGQEEANDNMQHQQVMGLVEHAFELLESHPVTTATAAAVAAAPSSSSSSTSRTTSTDLNLTERSTQVETSAMEMSPEKQALKETIQFLLHDLALVKDFAGTELAVTTEVLQEVQEEGLEREKALTEEVGEMKEELGRVQAMMAAVRAEAEEQARRDSQAIQELEVTVQLTEGALLLAKQQEQQAAATAATAAAVLPEGAMSPSSTVKLQGAMAGLRSQLQETERRAHEAEVGRGKLMQELEGMEDRLLKAEKSLAAAAAVAAAAAAAETAAAAAESAAVEDKTVEATRTPAKNKPITTSTSTSMTPRTPGQTAAAAAAAASTPSSSAAAMQTTAALRRLQAELLQTKAQLDTAKTNTTLLQRYIATRRLQSAYAGAAAGAAGAAAITTKLLLGEGGSEGPVRAAAELYASPAPASASKKAMARLLFSPPSSAPAAAAAAAATAGGDEGGIEPSFPSTSSSGVSSLFSFEAAANFFSFASSSSAVAAAAPARDETH